MLYSRWSAFIVFLVGIMCSLFLLNMLSTQQSEHLLELTQVRAHEIQKAISVEVTDQIKTLSRMVKRWELSGGGNQTAWEDDAKWQVLHKPAYQAIEWVDATYHVRWVVPQKGNEQAKGLDLTFEQKRKKSLDSSKNQNQIIMTEAIDLVQGGKGFLVYLPIFNNNKFEGFILGVFRIKNLLDIIFEDTFSDYSISITDTHENSLYVRQQNETISDIEATDEILLFGVKWNVFVSPNESVLTKEQWLLPRFAFLFGTLISLLFGGLVYFLQKAQKTDRLKDLNKKLKEEIVERKKTEAFLDEIYQNADSGLFIVNVINEENFSYAGINSVHEKLIGDIPNDWIIGKTPDDLIKYFKKEEIELIYQLYRQCVAEKKTITQEHPVLINNEETWWLSKISPLIDDRGKVYRLIGTGVQITERKHAEEKIKTALKEKDTLLHEIHHRVKNNMQVINSLLKLQSNNIEDSQIKNVLKVSQSRVYAMSAVHETLHGSEKLSEIDLKSYLSKIANSIFQTYSTDNHKIELNSNIENSPISINQAYPLGLVINELISNSLKYAFPGDRQGEITVQLKKRGQKLNLIVMDDGIGIPKELDWKNSSSLGLKLVHTLVENQLDGSIEMESKNGTKFTVKFNIES